MFQSKGEIQDNCTGQGVRIRAPHPRRGGGVVCEVSGNDEGGDLLLLTLRPPASSGPATASLPSASAVRPDRIPCCRFPSFLSSCRSLFFPSCRFSEILRQRSARDDLRLPVLVPLPVAVCCSEGIARIDDVKMPLLTPSFSISTSCSS